MLRELSFNFRDCNLLSGLASWAPLGAAAGTVKRSVSGDVVRVDGGTGWTAAAGGDEIASAGSRRCVADRSPVAWQALVR